MGDFVGDRLNTKKYSVAEIFCGCGGFSHGFARTGRFEVVLGIDVKREALRTFEHNHRSDTGLPSTIRGDVRSVSIEQIQSELSSKGIGEGELDCLIGGPPCQGFSQLRRDEHRCEDGVSFRGYNRLSEDPRNDLVLRFLEIAAALKPRFVVIENVPQMLRHGFRGRLGGLAQAIHQVLTDLGYDVAEDALNAADYGVPQLRERAIFIASRDGKATLPVPTHTMDNAHSDLSKWVTVRDAIADLPEPPCLEDQLAGSAISTYRSRTMSSYARNMQSKACFPNCHVTRPYAERILRLIHRMRPGETWDAASGRMQAKYEKLIMSQRKPGESKAAVKQRLVAAQKILPTFYRKYYWSAYTRLHWDRPALTITANANFLGSGRFTHPDDDRGITPREAARLQSFDDDFSFVTTSEVSTRKPSIGVAMDMIGEAVPPLLGKAIASHLAGAMDAQRAGIAELRQHAG